MYRRHWYTKKCKIFYFALSILIILRGIILATKRSLAIDRKTWSYNYMGNRHNGETVSHYHLKKYFPDLFHCPKKKNLMRLFLTKCYNASQYIKNHLIICCAIWLILTTLAREINTLCKYYILRQRYILPISNVQLNQDAGYSKKTYSFKYKMRKSKIIIHVKFIITI